MAESSVATFYDGYGTHKYCCEINLWWTSSGATSAVLHASGGGWLHNTDGWNGSSINFAGQTRSGNCTSSGANSWVHSNWWWSDLNLGTATKTHSAQTISRTCKFNYGGKGEVSVTASISLPAKTSYAVTYNAGEGSGAPSNQTKWYGETLTLQTGIPTRAGFAFKGWSGSNGTTYQPGSSYTGNAALTLTAIWQALVTDLEDVEDCEIGEAPVLAWTPQSEDLYYMINFSLGEWSWLTQPLAPHTTERYVYNSYTIPMEVCSQLPDQTEGLMKVELETYNAGELTGVSEKYFKVSVPDTVVPEITSLTLTDASENALEVYLQNYSWVSASLGYAGAYGSSIVSATMGIGGNIKTVEPESSPVTLVSDILPEDGVVTLTFTVTDQRGRTTTETRTVTVYEYERPTVSLALSLEGTDTLVTTVQATYNTVGGRNSGYISFDGGSTRTPITDNYTAETRETIEYPESRNYTKTAIVYDAVTSATATQDLYPGKGNRFSTLSADEYYIGIDDKGWKDTASDYNGGIKEDGTIWFERTSGTGPLGIGFPVQLEPDSDYEFIYSANKSDEDTVAFVSFFQQTGEGERGFHYMSTTYEAGTHFGSGAIFHTPTLETGTLWGVIVLGVSPDTYEDIIIGYQEFSQITLRKFEMIDEALEWEVETGTLGLDTPNQKYISRLQLRIEYMGTLKIGIAYDNAPAYETVHTSSSAQMRSRTVAINVRRCDHFRMKLEGVGQAKLYSFGYNTEDGSARCLI